MCGRARTGETGESIINTIGFTIARLTGAEKVFFLHHNQGHQRYDFLAMLPGKAQLSFRRYQWLVEDECREHGSVKLWCCHTAEANKYLTAGHIFYSLACTADRLVYDDGRPIPRCTAIKETVVEEAQASFNALFALPASFLDGARYHAAKNQLSASGFALHQATEHALRALLFAVAGYNGRGHDLNILFRHCHYCAPSLCTLFPQDSDAEIAIFHLLNNAYLHTRYRRSYKIGYTDLATLLSRVGEMHGQIRTLFEERLLTFKTHFLCQTK